METEEISKRVNAAVSEVTELFERLLPQAERLDDNMARFLVVFPAGVVPTPDDDGLLTGLALVHKFDWNLLSELLGQGSETGDPQARAMLCAWVDGVLLSRGTIPIHPVAGRIAQSVARWRLNGEEISKAPTQNRDVARHAAYRLGASIAERHGFKLDKNDLSSDIICAADIVIAAAKNIHKKGLTRKIPPSSYDNLAEIIRKGERVRLNEKTNGAR